MGGINVGWRRGGSLGFYVGLGYTSGGFAAGWCVSRDYNFRYKQWNDSTGVSISYRYEMGLSVSASYNNRGGWGVGVGFGKENESGTRGFSLGLGINSRGSVSWGLNAYWNPRTGQQPNTRGQSASDEKTVTLSDDYLRDLDAADSDAPDGEVDDRQERAEYELGLIIKQAEEWFAENKGNFKTFGRYQCAEFARDLSNHLERHLEGKLTLWEITTARLKGFELFGIDVFGHSVVFLHATFQNPMKHMAIDAFQIPWYASERLGPKRFLWRDNMVNIMTFREYKATYFKNYSTEVRYKHIFDWCNPNNCERY